MKIMADKIMPCLLNPILRFLSYVEVFISNMPMTIAAVGLSWVTQGVIWFKFMGASMLVSTQVLSVPFCRASHSVINFFANRGKH